MAIQFGSGEGFSLRPMQETNRGLLSSLKELGTQKRINSAADDAAGLAIAERLSAFEAAAARGVRNLNDGISVAKVADGGLERVSDDLLRMRELTVQAQNGTLNDADRAVIQDEIDQLAAGIDQTVRATEFNGRKLLDGSAGGGTAIEVVDGSGEVTGSVDVEDQSAAALGVDALDVAQPLSIQSIDAAIDKVTDARGKLGAVANRFASQVRTELGAIENVAASRSRIEDVSLAEAVSDRTKHQILLSAQLGLQAHSRLDESAVLQLLG
ncbi:MAG: flagellin [Planctomycetes bacterium]|nr:flagellin [Planctomycetota bacterium]